MLARATGPKRPQNGWKFRFKTFPTKELRFRTYSMV